MIIDNCIKVSAKILIYLKFLLILLEIVNIHICLKYNAMYGAVILMGPFENGKKKWYIFSFIESPEQFTYYKLRVLFG